MKQVTCGQCRQTFAMTDTFDVLGRQLCQPCAGAELLQEGGEGAAEDSLIRQVDPTICAQCGADHGHDELSKIAGLPVCVACEEAIRNRPYPPWLRFGFSALVALAIFCFIYNWRFFAAYRELHQAQQALEAAKIEDAAQLSEAAARHVPEVSELKAAAALNRGMALLIKDEPAQAVEAFKRAKESAWSSGPVLDQLLLRAESGVAFDAKDYDEFLVKSKALAAAAPKDAIAAAGVASAYACKYAVSGSEKDRDQAREQLEEAGRLAGPSDPDFAEYRGRIEHRLETREVVSRAEYQRRFPSGYQAGSKP